MGTVGTANRLHVATALFGATIVPSFLGHLESAEARELFLCFYLVDPSATESGVLTSSAIIVELSISPFSLSVSSSYILMVIWWQNL